MDTESLVENLILDGQRLLEYLPQNGFDVTAAFWLKPSENGRWHYYLVSPVVDAEGVTPAYRRLHTLIRQMPPPVWIDPLKVKLIGPGNPIARDVLAVHARTPDPRVSPIRWGGTSLGNVSIDDAYLYPLPAAAA
jgi:hypothetical protein